MRKHKNKKWFAPSFFLETFGAIFFFAICKLIGLDLSSQIGGWLGVRIGPLLKKRNQIAYENLSRAMPELSDEEKDKIIKKMWRHIGRTLAEYPHLSKFRKPKHQWRLQTEYSLETQKLALDKKQPNFFFSGHFTNWELMPLAISSTELKDLTIAEIYQKIKNPYINFWISRLRSKVICKYQIEKTDALRNILYHTRHRHSFASLTDQKMLSGVWTWFFHQPAQTSKFPATLALKKNYLLFPCTIKRIEKGFRTRFHITICSPLQIEKQKKSKENIQKITQQINYCLEMFIREQPENWLWLHRRWPDPGSLKRQARNHLHYLQQKQDQDSLSSI